MTTAKEKRTMKRSRFSGVNDPDRTVATPALRRISAANEKRRIVELTPWTSYEAIKLEPIC